MMGDIDNICASRTPTGRYKSLLLNKLNNSSISLCDDQNYYSIDDYNGIVKMGSQFTVYSLNINSFLKYNESLDLFLHSMNESFSVIILTELRSGAFDLNKISTFLPNYSVLSVPPNNTKCGGVAIFILNSIPFKPRKNIEIKHKGVENIFVEILINKHKWVIGGLYKHPFVDLNIFSTYMHDCLDQISPEENIIIGGDFNIDLNKYDDNIHIKNYIDNLMSRRLYQIILAPTRITNTTETIIDHFYIKSNFKIQVLTGIFAHPISDHLATFCRLASANINYKERPLIRLHLKKNIEKFKYELKSLNDTIIESPETDPDELWNLFMENIAKSYDKCFPLVKISRKKIKEKPWLTPALKKSCKTKEKLYKKYMKSKSIQDESKYKAYKNSLNKLIKAIKYKYNADKISDDKTNKKLWNEIATVLGSRTKKETIPNLKINNLNVSDEEEISNQMNKFFANIGENLARKLPMSVSNFEDYLSDPPNKSIFLPQTTTTITNKIIDSLCNKKSSGFDKVSQYLLKTVKESVTNSLTKLINVSISKQVYPSSLKTAKVIPIFKGGDKTNPSNYRPISLLSSFNKIFEKTLQINLIKFVEKHDILYCKQFGFRKYHSTTDALMATHDYIISCLNGDKKVLGIFIDLKKAFDSIDIQILLKKLNFYGIAGPFNNILRSYLTNRYVITEINNTKSSPLPIHFGVPQGSVLGPLLFSLYINDIKFLAQTYEIKLFADDTSLFCTADSFQKLEVIANQALIDCNKWLISNKLTVNTEKTHYLIFKKTNKSSPSLKLSLGNVEILEVPSTKYLGLTIQNNLKWNEHINNTINKINKLIPFCFAIRKILPEGKRLLVYNALIQSKINYAVEIYGRKNNLWLSQLQISQNRILKILFYKNKLFSTNVLHKEIKILKVTDLSKVRLCLIIHRKLYTPNLQPKIFNDDPIHFNQTNRRLRNATNYNIFVTTETYNYINKVTDSAVIVWNDTPGFIRCIKNRENFKACLTDECISKYK